MRFSLSLSRAMAAYLMRKRWAGERRFPLVLMLEPLHACNLSCAGCGRIREYADTLGRRLSVDECLSALDECGAPIVSVCGGEPLIYPELPALVDELLNRGRHIYLCTNGFWLSRKLPELPRDRRLFLNVHLDGMHESHDRRVRRAGVFEAAIEGIRAAKAERRMVYTNTTVYRDTDMCEIEVLFALLTELRVDGMMVSPAYAYQAVRDGQPGEDDPLFMSRAETQARFRQARAMFRRYKVTASPVYLDFLCGQRDLQCAAWANPTYNVRGWRGPCYFVGERHYRSYAELMAATDWDALGPERDPRCRDCLAHCGFEPAAVFAAPQRWRDMLAMALWQFS